MGAVAASMVFIAELGQQPAIDRRQVVTRIVGMGLQKALRPHHIAGRTGQLARGQVVKIKKQDQQIGHGRIL